jgi:energy-coupling factor transport system ATP-binding protein
LVLSLEKTVRSFKSGEVVVAEARGVSVRHGARIAVDEVSLELAAGEVVALTGPNGAGKSSLLTALALPRESGRVFVRGDDVHALKPRARRSAIALVPEVVDDLFVTDSVAAECRRADRRLRPTVPTLERLTTLFGADARTTPIAGSDAGRADTLLAQTHPRDLSGGQRVCLALALQLAAEPAVLLVDEPVRGLDPSARAEVAAALTRAAQGGTAVLFATHEVDFAARVAQRSIRLEAGRIVQGEAVIA